MAVDLSNQTVGLRNFTPINTGSADDGKILSRHPDGDDSSALLIFEQIITAAGERPNNEGSANAQAGGGYHRILPNTSNGVGDGFSGSNLTSVNFTDDPLFPGGVVGIRDTYRSDTHVGVQSTGSAYTFGNQTWFIDFPPRRKFYYRVRVRWSANWQWGNDQLKFCKNDGANVTTNCPVFRAAGVAFIGKATPPAPGGSVYADIDALGITPSSTQREDDFTNTFGAGNTDGNWSPTLDTWTWIETEIDAGLNFADNPTNPGGHHRIWIDGVQYMGIENTSNAASAPDPLFDQMEFGHVWQEDSGGVIRPTNTIHMDFHSMRVYSERPGLPPGL